MKRLLLLFCLFFIPLSGSAQILRYNITHGTPSACNQPFLNIDETNNVLYFFAGDGTCKTYPLLSGNNTWPGTQTFSAAPLFSTMTSGSVLFAGTAGLLSQDNANLFWDNTNKRMGIGTATPTLGKLQIDSGTMASDPQPAGLYLSGTLSNTNLDFVGIQGIWTNTLSDNLTMMDLYESISNKHFRVDYATNVTTAGNINGVSPTTFTYLDPTSSVQVQLNSKGGGSVTQVDTAAPLSGGPITGTGTVSCPTCLAAAPDNNVKHALFSNSTNVQYPVFDAAGQSTFQDPAVTSYSWSHTIGSGNNRILVVGAITNNSVDSTTGVTFNGVAMTQGVGAGPAGAGVGFIRLWYMLESALPTAGTYTITVTQTNDLGGGGSLSYSEVSQTNPFDNTSTTSGVTLITSSSITPNVANVGIGSFLTGNTNQLLSYSGTLTQEVLVNHITQYGDFGAAQAGPVSGVQTDSWTFAGQTLNGWVDLMFSLTPAPVGPPAFRAIASSDLPTNLVINGNTKSATYSTATNCADNAGAAACGSAAAGAFVIDSASTATVVSTTAVTANSRILITEGSYLATELGITCNTTVVRAYSVTAIVAGTSFTVTASAAPITYPACLSYVVVN